MFNKALTMTAIASALVLAGGPALAADQVRDQTRQQDQIYGSQLMTEQERNQYRNRMRSAKTVQEREQIRAEHHKQMQARAKERGVTIPDEPPVRGGGMGPGGGGMGPGGRGGR